MVAVQGKNFLKSNIEEDPGRHHTSNLCILCCRNLNHNSSFQLISLLQIHLFIQTKSFVGPRPTDIFDIVFSNNKGQMVSSRCERELKKLECIINYNGQSSEKGSERDRGDLLLKLQ